MPPEFCHNCGAEIPATAAACPECGSDETTGWSEQARVGNLGLPDEEFDHDEFVKEEFGDRNVKPRGIGWFWWAIALLLAGFLLFLFLR
jgi:uncharacterized membrane protein YvbJ